MIRKRKLHGVDHHVRVRASVATEDLVGEQLRARSNADDLASGCVAASVSRGDARYVRAVSAV